MKRFALILLAALTWSVNAQTTCVDPLACNFTELGECEFLDDNGMPCVTEGCAIPGACNFNPEADINDGSCEFTSCLGCTDEAACNYDPEAVYLDSSCIYFVDCNGVCGGDWIEDECGNCYSPSTIGGESIVTDYAFSSNHQFISWPTGAFAAIIELWGAEGGNGDTPGDGFSGSYPGGLGGYTKAKINFSDGVGEGLYLLIGGMGQDDGPGGYNGGGASGQYGGSGGGATDIRLSLNDLDSRLAVAGGGGGGNSGSGFGYGGDGGGLSGQNGVALGPHPEGLGGTQDYGGQGFGSGGAFSVSGSFGLGGSSQEYHMAGGGSGWYGGGGAYAAGGGGGSSYVGSDLEVLAISAGVNAGHGSARIEFLFQAAPECELGCVIAQACNFDPEATNDDGSCDFCFCGPGTEYDLDLGQCMIVNGSPDINGDGCTNLGDLLDLLSGYGTCED